MGLPLSSPQERAIAAQVLKEHGHEAKLVADLLGVSVSQVHRYWSEFPPLDDGGSDRSAVEDLQRLIESQELDEMGRFQAGVAIRLAQRLDKIASSDKAQDALAMPQIAKELRAVVAELMGASENDREWLADLSSPLDDSTHLDSQDDREAAG